MQEAVPISQEPCFSSFSVSKSFSMRIMGKNNESKFAFILFYISVLTRQRINMGSMLALLRVNRPNIIPYMGLQWADLYCLSRSIIKIGSIINKL